MCDNRISTVNRMCMWDGADDPQFWKAAVRRASKRHRCVECGRDIESREHYHYVFQVYEGDAYSFHTCSHCCIAQQWLIRECGGYLIEAVWEDISEHVREYPVLRFPLGHLLVGRRHKWMRLGVLLPVPTVPSASVEQYVV